MGHHLAFKDYGSRRKRNSSPCTEVSSLVLSSRKVSNHDCQHRPKISLQEPIDLTKTVLTTSIKLLWPPLHHISENLTHIEREKTWVSGSAWHKETKAQRLCLERIYHVFGKSRHDTTPKNFGAKELSSNQIFTNYKTLLGNYTVILRLKQLFMYYKICSKCKEVNAAQLTAGSTTVKFGGKSFRSTQ